MGIRISVSDCIFTLTLVFALLSSPCLQASRCSDCSFTNTLLITNPKDGQTQNSFTSIQQAINEAESGATIIIPVGTFYEHVVINKTLTLIGEENFTSIIDGTNNGTVVEITADNAVIKNLKLQNSGYGWNRNGFYVHDANNITIESNFLHNVCHNIKIGFSNNSRILENIINGTMTAPTMYGIRIENSTNCTAIGNKVSDCVGAIHLQNTTNSIVARNIIFNNSQGLRFYSPCQNNEVFENIILNNMNDGMISVMPPDNTFANNTIFHNNFVNNTNPFIYIYSGFIWDKGYPSGGNYWSRYNETDLFSGPYQNETGNDGIGDKTYAVSESTSDRDKYPLMHSYGSVLNIDTNRTYLTIASAINAQETSDGHRIFVKSGTYYEHIVLNKTLSLFGENQTSTFIDGGRIGTVLTISADNVAFTGFTVQNSGSNFPPYGNDYGIFLDHNTGANVSQNRVLDNRIGIYLYFSTNNTIEHNTISSNDENGIWLWFSGNNTLAENQIFNNTYNFGVFGGDFSDFSNSIDSSNTVDDRSIHYLIGVEDTILDNQTEIGALYLINCFNITIRNLNLAKNGHGVFCYNVSKSIIDKVTVTENNYGICFQNSVDNIVIRNRCFTNWVGIYLQDSSLSTVENNDLANGEKGISLYEANNNTIEGNTIINATYGIRLFSSTYNHIFHNNLIENTEQASPFNSNQNTWDNGFEGNFWSNYTSPDENKDGIGDNYHIIDGSNQDHFPLLGTFHDFSAQYEEDTSNIEVISNSTILNLVFEDTSDTIRLWVNGSDQTYGFCRIRIPHMLIGPEILVIIDGEATPVLGANYNLRDDGFNRWIYFAYQHSSHEIAVVPEYWLPIFLFILAVLICSLRMWKPRRATERTSKFQGQH
jgi:parallel beta-helix repeat protein